jgi:uncharacterized membrane protein YadS
MKTCGLLPDLTVHVAKGVLRPGDHLVSLAGISEQISKICITISMAGVGLETKFASMRQTGLKPFLASLIAVLILAVLILAFIKAWGL